MMYDKDFEEINNALRDDSRRAFRRAFKQLCNTVPNDFKFTVIRVSTSKISPFTDLGRAKYFTISNGRVFSQPFKDSTDHSHSYEVDDFIFKVWNCLIVGNTFCYGHMDAHEIGDKYFGGKYIID